MAEAAVMKAEWKPFDFSRSMHPERRNDYALYELLVDINGIVIASIEQFSNNPRCFYANVAGERSGCLSSHDWARQWCETKTGNKVN